MLRSKDKFETSGTSCEVSPRLFGYMGRMIIQDYSDFSLFRVCLVYHFQEGDELSTSVPVHDHPTNMTIEQINAGHQTYRSVPDVFVITGPLGMTLPIWWQVRCFRFNCLNTRLFIIGQDGNNIRYVFTRFAQYLDFFINIKYLRHFCFEVRIATFQVIINFMRADICLLQYFGNGPFNNFSQASMPRSRTIFSDMLSQKGT